MLVSYTRATVSVSFDEENLVSPAALLPVMRLDQDAGLHSLADEWLSVPTDKGANAGLKVGALVAAWSPGSTALMTWPCYATAE